MSDRSLSCLACPALRNQLVSPTQAQSIHLSNYGGPQSFFPVYMEQHPVNYVWLTWTVKTLLFHILPFLGVRTPAEE